jgi:hypothetical protein
VLLLLLLLLLRRNLLVGELLIVPDGNSWRRTETLVAIYM